MIDFLSLLSSVNAFKLVAKDKQTNSLSHAYLIIHEDGENLKTVLKNFAKIFLCEELFPCDKCLSCSRIESETYADLIVYPKDKEKGVVTNDIVELIEESYVKPIEGKKKIFIIDHAESMNPASQNKLLKTLEEPADNVHIILGTTNVHALLPTVVSRVKKLEIPAFDKDTLISVLSVECPDKKALKNAVEFSDGTIGGALAFYLNPDKTAIIDFVKDLIINMKSSKQIIDYSIKITDLLGVLDVLETIYKEMLLVVSGGKKETDNEVVKYILESAEGYNVGALIYALDKITEARKRLKFNGNEGAISEWLLFQILEGKYKWQKS